MFMQMTGNTILITGGSSGIGLELARQLCATNTVLITGRDEAKLAQAKSTLPAIHTFASDVSDPVAIAKLHAQVIAAFPTLNILINNAGIMRKNNLNDGATDLTDITREVAINLDGPIRMTVQFLPHLKKQSAAAIVNVSSGLAFVPFPVSPVYSATKAAIHAFTQALRVQMQKTRVNIFELAPPAVETPLLRGDFDAKDLGDMKGMDVTTLARAAISGMEKNVLGIRPGLSNVLKLMSLIAPGFALRMLTKNLQPSLDRMWTEAKP